MLLKIRKNKFAQSMLEYALLIAVIAAALMAMKFYLQRAAQANISVIEGHLEEEPCCD
jgi:Flp pilus assembly pilin Flp